MTDLLALSVLVSVIALLYARWEYPRRGHLTLVGLFLLCTMLFLPILMIYQVTRYTPPVTWVDYLGLIIAIAGLALCLASITVFASISKMLCLDSGRLTLDGPYHWSRNPQYVGWLMFLLGYALTDWSPWCLAALLVTAVSLHYLVLIEEQHLRSVFGEPYVEFCHNVPRYWSWRP